VKRARIRVRRRPRPAEDGIEIDDRDLELAVAFEEKVGPAFLLLPLGAQRMVLGRWLWAHAGRSGVPKEMRRLGRPVLKHALHEARVEGERGA
jgi:hypothetical protein